MLCNSLKTAVVNGRIIIFSLESTSKYDSSHWSEVTELVAYIVSAVGGKLDQCYLFPFSLLPSLIFPGLKEQLNDK